MRRDDRQHGKYANKTSHRRGGGTAARVRPFSFEEIMMRRNNQEVSQAAKKEYGRVELKSTIEVVEHISTLREPARVDKDSKLLFPYMDKHGSEDRSISRSKEELSQRGGKSTQGSHDGRNHTEESDMVRSRYKKELATIKEDVVIKGRAKKFPEPEAELRTIASNELKIKEIRAESYSKNRTGSKHDEKPENHERRNKRNRVETDKSIDTWSKMDQRLRNDPKDRGGKDSYRDQVVSDRFVGWIGGSSEKECKRKLHNADDRKAKNRSAVKKPDLGKSPDFEVLERKERKEGSRYDEAMIKRKRSRSRERDQDRMSISLSPKAHKHRSSGRRSHGELASHCRDDRPGKQPKDGERSKFPSNGLDSNYDGEGGSAASGLGGYSPRKRKTESAIKTPSPTNRSPEKKRAGWDIPPTGAKEVLSSSVPHGSQSVSLSASTNVQELVSAVTAALNMTKTPLGSSGFLPTRNSASIDSIQLTESTRPMRRLYVENLPTSTSEKALMDCLNHFFLSSGVNHILGTQPCISCMIHKERCQALVEFLTPEDASAALSFDGSYFSGSVLKIRRPKDFVDMAVSNGDTVQEAKPAATPSVNMMSDIVVDSPQKVFVGGIAASLSAEMLMEIVRAFGPLKAFHLETKMNSNERYAFIEYIDPSVTPIACAGLNGMKLGDQMLTVVRSVLDSSSMEHAEISSTYTVPDHAKPLLEMPTTVLKLKNVFTPEELVLLSKTEVEKVLEDIRLECARFGTIKSVNVYQQANKSEVCGEMKNEEVSGKTGHEVETGVANNELRNSVEYSISHEDEDADTRKDEHGNDGIKKAREEIAEAEVTEFVDNDDLSKDEQQQQHSVNNSADDSSHLQAAFGSEDVANHGKTLNAAAADLPKDAEPETCPLEEAKNFTSTLDNTSVVDEEDEPERQLVFEAGDVFVEYKRIQGCCLAAHCLHGRLFEERVVMVEYVPLHLYRSEFSP